MDLGELGTHPLHLVANAFSFDHYTHIRVDLLAPLGPMSHPAPPSNEVNLTAAIDWIVAAIPQMDAEALAAIDAPVALVLTGLGGRRVQFGPEGDPVSTVTSSTADLVLWGTRRRDWRELDIELAGDEYVASRFCDAIHVF